MESTSSPTTPPETSPRWRKRQLQRERAEIARKKRLTSTVADVDRTPVPEAEASASTTSASGGDTLEGQEGREGKIARP